MLVITRVRGNNKWKPERSYPAYIERKKAICTVNSATRHQCGFVSMFECLLKTTVKSNYLFYEQQQNGDLILKRQIIIKQFSSAKINNNATATTGSVSMSAPLNPWTWAGSIFFHLSYLFKRLNLYAQLKTC